MPKIIDSNSKQLDLFKNKSVEKITTLNEKPEDDNSVPHIIELTQENKEAKIIRMRPTIDMSAIYQDILNRTIK